MRSYVHTDHYTTNAVVSFFFKGDFHSFLFPFSIFPSCRTLRYMGVKWCCRALELHEAKQQKLHEVHDRHTKPQHLRTYYCKAYKEGTTVSFALVRRAARAHQSAHNRMPAPDHIRQVTRNIMHTARTCGLQCGCAWCGVRHKAEL